MAREVHKRSLGLEDKPATSLHSNAGPRAGRRHKRPWPFLKQEQFSCAWLGSSLKPLPVCKKGLGDISAALISTEKPSLTSASAQGVQMHPSHQAQSSSKQKVNCAPPSSAISEERGGKENVCRERQNQEMPCPKISSAWGTTTRSEEGHSQAEMPWTWQVAGQPAPARTQSQQAPCCQLPTLPGSSLPHAAPAHWSATPRRPGACLQHSIIAPAAAALHHSLPGARNTGESLGATPSSSTSTHRQRLLLAPCAQAACPLSKQESTHTTANPKGPVFPRTPAEPASPATPIKPHHTNRELPC